ncbi:hypothetical protein H5410_014078 [Solanum commersonii]|uniref:DUF7745 domain-containing protein n=1 Tax=Solanum commersonii TaxID=4109 RepID=A0A9J5ZPZ8_SOLCO|nr:hypothetical protein H5410_014078 [Solanum commersonii]
MAPPTKGQGFKRPRSEGIPEFMIVDTIPTNLWRWWADMGSHEQRKVKEHLGHLVHLMEIDPRRDVIEALIPFWDSKNNVFRFSDFEMTPTLEEIASFMGKGSVEKESLKNEWVSLDFLYERYGQKDGFKNYRNQLSNQGGEEAWKANGCFAFMVAFLGLMVFPKRDKHIDILGWGGGVDPDGESYYYSYDLADMFTPDWCNYVFSHKEREAKIDFPKGIIACEEKLSGITSDEIVEIPPNDDMSRFVFDTPPGFAFDSSDILKIWFGSIIFELSEMVVEQDKGKVVPGYLSWFRDPTTFDDISEGSSRKRKDQHIIRQLEKELEKAKTTIARQEIQVQRGKNIQLELQDTEGELKHAEGKLARLEEELDSRIHLARQIKKEQSFEISRLKRDLVASEEVVNYQRGKLKRRKEKFEKERSGWMHLHDRLKAELEDHKRRISQCVDIEEGQRQMIIERATLRHQLEAAEEREALLRNNLGDHQVWLNNCYENMGKARRQVHQLAEQTSYVIKNHRRMNDPEVAEQARAIVPHLPKVLLNLYVTLGGQRKPKEDDED